MSMWAWIGMAALVGGCVYLGYFVWLLASEHGKVRVLKSNLKTKIRELDEERKRYGRKN